MIWWDVHRVHMSYNEGSSGTYMARTGEWRNRPCAMATTTAPDRAERARRRSVATAIGRDGGRWRRGQGGEGGSGGAALGVGVATAALTGMDGDAGVAGGEKGRGGTSSKRQRSAHLRWAAASGECDDDGASPVSSRERRRR